METLTFESNNRKIVFEPKKELPDNFIEAKDWLNSRTLRTGKFPLQCFNKDLCRGTTEDELNDYIALKDRSLFALNADE
jgi:hypothetical protein